MFRQVSKLLNSQPWAVSKQPPMDVCKDLTLTTTKTPSSIVPTSAQV